VAAFRKQIEDAATKIGPKAALDLTKKLASGENINKAVKQANSTQADYDEEKAVWSKWNDVAQQIGAKEQTTTEEDNTRQRAIGHREDSQIKLDWLDKERKLAAEKLAAVKAASGATTQTANVERKQFKNSATGQLDWFHKIDGKWVKE
jgi:hypothetical protein